MQFEYEIKYSKRKTLNITVERDRKIIVRAPENTSAQKIEEVLQSKNSGLKKKLIIHRSTQLIHKPKNLFQVKLYYT